MTPGFEVILTDKKVLNNLKKLYAMTKDLRPVFIPIKDDWYKQNWIIFTTAGPGRYTLLSADYARWKYTHLGYYTILKGATLTLQSAMTSETDENAIREITKNSMTLGVNGNGIPYALIHQRGGRITRSNGKSTKMPARPYILNSHTDKSVSHLWRAQAVRWSKLTRAVINRRMRNIYGGANGSI